MCAFCDIATKKRFSSIKVLRIPRNVDTGVSWLITSEDEVIACVNWNEGKEADFNMNEYPSGNTRNSIVVGKISGDDAIEDMRGANASLSLTNAVMEVTHELLAQSVEHCHWGNYFAEKPEEPVWLN